MSELLASVSQFLMYAVEGYCIQKLFRGFLKTRWGNGRYGKAAVGLVWLVLRYTASMVIEGQDGEALVKKLLFYAFGIFCFCLVWYVDKIQWKLFLVILFLSLHELSFFAGYSIMTLINKWLLDALLFGFEQKWMGDQAFLDAVFVACNIILFFMVFVEGALLYGTIRSILKVLDKKYWGKTDRELIFYMLPAVAGLLITLMLRSSMFVMEEDNWILLYDRYPALEGIVPCIAMVLLISVVFNFWLYQKMLQQNERQKEQQILKSQISQMQAAMQDMERLYDGIRSARHDMKNQILAVKGMMAEQKEGTKEIQEFVSELYHSVEQLDYGMHTGNSVCDVVIGSKFAYAREKLQPIRLSGEDFTVAEAWGIKAYDMGIMLSNGLDNAIEAILRMRKKQPQKEAYIVVKSYMRGGMVFVEIENNFNGLIEFEEGMQVPLSQKEGDAHGIGLLNIKNCARKYRGEADCIVEGEKFILSIMLKKSGS